MVFGLDIDLNLMVISTSYFDNSLLYCTICVRGCLVTASLHLDLQGTDIFPHFNIRIKITVGWLAVLQRIISC